MLALAFLFVCSSVCCVVLWQHNRRVTRTIDRMMDEILNGEPISQPTLEEGAVSALASKVLRVQEKVDASVADAEREREAVKQLVSNMAHQLKTPLAGLVMYREMLEDPALDSDTRAHFLMKMKGQTEKLDWILGALFKMVALEEGAVVFEAQALPLHPTLVDAVNTVIDKAEQRNITISLERFNDRLLWHNRKWTAEVFVNLLENAIKYTEPGGKVIISVRPLELYTEIRFCDNGRGIRPEELALIFQRFYRSSDVEGVAGSGIGLALSRMILDHEKGYITATSDFGRGSTFSVYLQNAEF